MKLVCNLENAIDPIYGNKAKNLALLIKGGFKVPAGFAISSEYMRYLDLSNQNIISKINDDFSYLLKNKEYIARSSSLNEDSKVTMASGIYESYSIKSSIGEAIFNCYKSASSNRAIQYKIDKGLDLDESLGVVIQEKVKGKYSAVLFTANQITGNANEMLLDIHSGSCDSLTSGAVNPNSYLFDKSTKEIELLGGNELIENKLLLDIFSLGTKVENYSGSPQDIELVLADDFYLLQSRPITGIR
jgi:phosphoenolpyruvate synthase/pyruvate phosphate dikinase